MVVYKLGDIGNFKGGISNLKKERYGIGINFINYMDIFNNWKIKKNTILRKYNATKNEIFKYGVKFGDAFFTASSETPKEIAMSSIYLSKEKAIFNGFSKRYRFNKSILKPEYASYLFRGKIFREKVKKYATGYTRYNVSQKNLEKIKINIPTLKIQKQIIDIIEPHENLFLKYYKCVRINKIQNTKNDIKNLIDIIEPIEKQMNLINYLINKIKKFLINKYIFKKTNYINFNDIISKKVIKRNKEYLYIQTNAVSELNINYSKILNLKKIKIPSRANLKPINNSIIFSKLLGENKVIPWIIDLNKKFIVSTGFYNIQTNYSDHVLSFLLTKNFKKQKEIFSTGTTMIGINDKSLNKIKIKNSNNQENIFSILIFKLIFLKINIEFLKNKIISLLVK